MVMEPLIIIPARYASTRFPGKPLAIINGKTMVQHVWEKCIETSKYVIVATDNKRIFNTVTDFGGLCLMTSPNHPSGTDRCAEAAKIMDEKISFDIVINVQGDEPFIEKEQLIQLFECFKYPDTDIATLITQINDSETLFDPNKVKVVTSLNGFAMYFSRQAIPFQRDCQREEWLKNSSYFCHLGIYAFKKEVLYKISQLKQTPLEKNEKLEQLRWLENNFKIKTAVTSHSNLGVDTPDDLKNLLDKIKPTIKFDPH